MSFSLRTSIGVGPLRVSMSRSGLGASVGVPGFRLGAGPRGTYVSLGGGLISYRATVRSPRGSSAARTTQVVRSSAPMSGSSDLVAQLNDAARSALLWPWCLAFTITLMFLWPLLFLAGAPLTLWVFWKDRVRRTVVAFYDVHGAEEARRFQQQYVNVSGGPDRRFTNNRQLPILQYGRLTLFGKGGYSATFDFSNPRRLSHKPLDL